MTDLNVPEVDDDDCSTDEEEACRNFDEEAELIVDKDSYPKKSFCRYKLVYDTFNNWKSVNKATATTENVLIVYFQELKAKCKPTTLWSVWSMLKRSLNTKENIDIGAFANLKNILKVYGKGYKPTKASVFQWNQIMQFMKNAPNFTYLATKVLLIFGICGACRCDELHNLKWTDIEDDGKSLMVYLTHTKNDKAREFYVGPLFYKEVKSYMLLRPDDVPFENFFSRYGKGTCSRQVIGRNTIGQTPKKVATFLNLANLKRYTGHSLRRTGTTLAAESGADVELLMQLGGWTSEAIARGYVEHSKRTRMKIFNAVTQQGTSVSPIQLQNEASTSSRAVSAIDMNRPSTSKQNFPESTSNVENNTGNDFDLNWDDFSVDFELDTSVSEKKNSDTMTALNIPKSMECQSAASFATAKHTKVAVHEEENEAPDTLQTKKLNHFTSRPPVRLPLKNISNNSYQPDAKRFKTYTKQLTMQSNNNTTETVPVLNNNTTVSEEKGSSISENVVRQNNQDYMDQTMSHRKTPIVYENCTFNNATINNYFYY